MDTAVDSIITMDGEGIIESVNPAAERMFGYALDEMVGQNIKLLMPSPHREAHDEYLANYLLMRRLWKGKAAVVSGRMPDR